MDKQVRIVLELITRGFNSGVTAARGLFKGFVSGVTDGALNAARSLTELARTVFFVREAIDTLVRAGKWLFDTFVRGAGDAAKLEAKLKNVTGSSEDAERVMALLRQTAADTGANFEELADGAGLMAVAAKDASGAFDFNKFQRLMNLLQRAAALRPDVPLDRLARGISNAAKGDWSSLEMFLDVQLRQLLGISDAIDKVAEGPEQIGRAVTFIETGVGEAADQALADLDKLDEALTKAGATSELIGDIAELSGLERFQQILKQITDTIGEPVFEVFNRELSKLADWLEANPDKVEAFAESLGTSLAGALELLVGWLEQADWDKLAADLENMAASLENIGETADKINKFVEDVKAVQDWLNTANVNVNQAGQDVGEFLGTNKIGEQLAQTPIGQLLKLEVHVTSDNEMFNAQVKQISDGAVAEGLNQVSQELEGGQ